MTELKPCPFCGGEAAFGANSCQGFEYVRCVSCKARTWSCYNTEEQAAEAWNTRAELTCHVEYVNQNESDSVGVAICSECGSNGFEIQNSNYCSYCGAKVVE